MNAQNQLNNAYLIVIPRNCTNDIHICGRCKVQYTLLNLFLEHKANCNAQQQAEMGDVKSELNREFSKRIEVDNLIEINELDTLVDSDKDCNQLVMLNSLLNKDQLPLKQFKIDIVEGNEICISQGDICLNNSHNNLLEQKLASPSDYKRTLQNDEEDIATLLANQLSSEASADDLNVDGGVEMQAEDPIDEIDHPKENEEKDEKIMYRGKMRKLFTCSVGNCSYKTLLRKDIERHTRVHTGERPFKCFICNKAFTRTDKLLLHQRIHAGDKRYKCTKCDYASVDSGSLIKHLRVHNDERPFKCQLCSYRARDSSQLTVHLRTHTGDSPFICTNDNCKAAFKTSSDLKRHMIIHSGEKPHSCLYCPYKCTLKRNLQIHVQSQHPNGELKEYRCHMCPRYTFPTIRRLKNHLKKHHSEVDKVTDEKAEKQCAVVTGDGISEKQSAYRKKRRKNRRSSDKVAVGVMNKAYDCKLCEASFVCQDSLLTHQRYHSKVEEEIRKSEFKRESLDLTNQCAKKGKFKKVGTDEEGQKRLEQQFGDNLVLNEGYVIENNSFNDSLRNAEILASINPIQGNDNMRQYVMLAPGMIQSAYTAEEYVLTTN